MPSESDPVKPTNPIAAEIESPVVTNPWSVLKQFTPARIGLGRAGVSLPTSAQLDFQLAHAQARDAVHRPLEVQALCSDVEALGLETLPLHSAATTRSMYLQRPDLGRQLDVSSRQRLEALRARRQSQGGQKSDLVFAVVDGLSALAVQRHAAPLLSEVLALLDRSVAGQAPRWTVAPVAVVEQGRVAIGDEIGGLLDGRIVVEGERSKGRSPFFVASIFPEPSRRSPVCTHERRTAASTGEAGRRVRDHGCAQRASAEVCSMNGSHAVAIGTGGGKLEADSWSAYRAESRGRDVVSVVLSWGDASGAAGSKNVVDVKSLSMGQSLTVGESAGADIVLPSSVLGSESAVIFTSTKSEGEVNVPKGALAFADGVPSFESTIPLTFGHRIDLVLGDFVIHFELGSGSLTPTATLADILHEMGMPGLATSATLHVALLAAFAFFMPRLSSDDAEGLARDQILLMQKFLNASAEADRERQEVTADTGADTRDGSPNSGGAAARGDSGSMGQDKPVTKAGHWTQAGDARPNEVTLSRERMIKEAQTEGMIGLLSTMAIADPNGPVVPFGTIPNGADQSSNPGDFWSADPGSAFGPGAGLSGVGEGGGGRADGIGVNDVGGLGKSLSSRNGSDNPGGVGGRTGSIGGLPGHKVQGPSMHFAANVDVNGHLPPEVIQRIVRLSQGRYIACYQSGLRTNPALEGRVGIRFLISKSGEVSTAQDHGSDLPDQNVRACIVRAFQSLSFPNPEGGGSVSVTYPLVFSPSS